MNATDWLLFCLIAFCLICLLAIIIGKMIDVEWNEADAPDYRTADGKAIEEQTEALRRKAQWVQAESNHNTSAPAKVAPIKRFNPRP